MKSLRIAGIILSLLFLTACSKSETSRDSGLNNYAIKLIDSVNLHILADPVLADVNKSGDKILFIDWASEEYITINRVGKILGRFSKNEDTPDNPGFLFRWPAFRDSEEIVFYGMNGIFYFDIKGKLTRKQRSPAPSNAGTMVGLIGRNIKIV
jgi:hypothetical protein